MCRRSNGDGSSAVSRARRTARPASSQQGALLAPLEDVPTFQRSFVPPLPD
jgi:hypothetical protein